MLNRINKILLIIASLIIILNVNMFYKEYKINKEIKTAIYRQELRNQYINSLIERKIAEINK